MDAQPRRKLIVSLPDHVYSRLEAEAAANDRVVAQQAAYLLRTWLERDCAEDQQQVAGARP